MFREQKGITLVALVITIIVLLILAGVTIAALSGPNGILTNATQSTKDTAISEAREAVTMAVNTILTNQYVSVDDEEEAEAILSELNRDNIISEINANYGNKASAGTEDNQIKYTTGGYDVIVTMKTDDTTDEINWMKIDTVSIDE